MSTNELNIFVAHQLRKMVAVTGASGMLGAHFVFELTSKYNKVVALKRVSSKIDWVKRLFVFLDEENGADRWEKIEWRDADLTDVFSLADALQDATEVYHCAALVDLVTKSQQTIISNNVQGTANLIDVLVDLQQNVKLLNVSSIAALGKPETGNTITVTTEWKEDEEQSAYAISKYYSELEAWRGANEGLSVISVLPGLIIGSGLKYSPSMLPFNRILKGKRHISTGKVGLVSVNDVVKQSIALMQIEEAIGNRFVLVADNWSYKQWFDCMAKAMKCNVVFKLLSKKQLVRLSLLERVLCLFKGTARKLKKSTINALTSNNEYDGSQVIALTNSNYCSIKGQVEKVAAWIKQS